MNLDTLTLPLEVADKAFNVGVGAAVAVVTALVGAMGMAVKATFTWADELDSIQDVIGGTNEEAAALNFTLRKSGVDTETFNQSMVIMEKGLVKADGSLDTVGKAMEKWGINVKDANGKLKPQAELIGEVSKKYASLGTQQEKVNFLTETFGKGGAKMVDFFDTLAQEGGIDAVTQKVKSFGLVVDPARYEQFTRSLEEIKLAGLGLAVQFTEKLMPVFESLLQWVNSFRGLSLTEVLNKLGTDISNFMSSIDWNKLLQDAATNFANLGQAFADWAKSIDWAQVTADIITGIQSIDWATLGATIRTGFAGIFSGLNTIANSGDWQGVYNTINTATLDFIAGLSGQGSWANVKATWAANWVQLQQIVTSALGFVQSTWTATMGILPAVAASAMTMVKSNFQNALNSVKTAFTNIFSAIKTIIVNAISGAVNSALGFLGTLIQAINNLPSVGGNSGAQPGASTGTNGGRASGGYASGMTLVGENGPELVNLPSGAYVNNNLSSQRMANQPVQAFIDYDELGRVLGRVLGQQMQRTTR